MLDKKETKTALDIKLKKKKIIAKVCRNYALADSIVVASEKYGNFSSLDSFLMCARNSTSIKETEYSIKSRSDIMRNGLKNFYFNDNGVYLYDAQTEAKCFFHVLSFKEKDNETYEKDVIKNYNLYVYFKFFNNEKIDRIFEDGEEFVVRFPIVTFLESRTDKTESIIEFEEKTFNPKYIEIIQPSDLDKVSYNDYKRVSKNSNGYDF